MATPRTALLALGSRVVSLEPVGNEGSRRMTTTALTRGWDRIPLNGGLFPSTASLLVLGFVSQVVVH